MGSEEWQHKMFIRKLKVVKIDLINQGKNELKLIKNLLKYAKKLQKMTLFYASPLQSHITRKINEYKKASNAEVNFCQI